MTNPTLYKFHFDSNGTLYGLFIADKAKMEKLVADGNEIYFGEVCDFTEVTSDPAFLSEVKRLNLCFRYNPFDYLEDENEEK